MEVVFVFGTLIVIAAIIMTRMPVKEERHGCQHQADKTIKMLIVVRESPEDDNEISIEVIGQGMGHVAYIASYMTMLAAQNCEDGFEKGIEYIQADAMDLASGKFDVS